jgi:hypothetical protein
MLIDGEARFSKAIRRLICLSSERIVNPTIRPLASLFVFNRFKLKFTCSDILQIKKFQPIFMLFKPKP